MNEKNFKEKRWINDEQEASPGHQEMDNDDGSENNEMRDEHKADSQEDEERLSMEDMHGVGWTLVEDSPEKTKWKPDQERNWTTMIKHRQDAAAKESKELQRVPSMRRKGTWDVIEGATWERNSPTPK